MAVRIYKANGDGFNNKKIMTVLIFLYDIIAFKTYKADGDDFDL